MDVLVLGAGEFYLPIDESAVEVGPFGKILVLVEFDADGTKLLLVGHHGFFAHQPFCLGMFFDGEEYLVGFDRFDEVVGDLAAEGFVHDMFFLAFGDHHDGNLWMIAFDDGEGVQAAHAWHVFVEKHEVDGCFVEHFDGFVATGYGNHLIAFFLQEKDVRF